MLPTIAIGIYVAALTVAAASDLTRYEIPNMASTALVAAFVLSSFSSPSSSAIWHASAGLIVFGAAALLFAVGLCGGGDVKLLGATALWMGWSELLEFLCLMALGGGVLALVLMTVRGVTTQPAQTGHWYSRILQTDEGVPYGVAIAAAGLCFVPRLLAIGLTAG